MADLLVFPDATELVCNALADELNVTVGSQVPNPRPSQFVRVRRVGGVRHSHVIDASRLTIECWAPTDGAAHDLAQLARAVVWNLPGTTVDDQFVHRVEEEAGPADLPDPVSDQPRYTQTVVVHLRGHQQTSS